ncbi:ABC transporter permease [Paenibacillus pini]|nr:ABC transporter permease [Paenibacillus pini]
MSNENMKIYRRVRTWVMLGILVLINLGLPFLFSLTSSETPPNMWESFVMTMTFSFFLNTIFSVIIASDSVAAEFSWGTIKLLLIRPWSRSKILLSKYIAVILFSVFGTVLLFSANYISSAIWFNSHSQTTFIIPPDYNASKFALLTLLCNYVNLFMTVALAFMISTVFRTGGLAIGLSLFIMFTKGIFTVLFDPDKYVWANFLPFSHMDLSVFITSNTGLGGVSLPFSISVLAVYFLIFVGIAWFVFNKRDVAT